MKFDAEMARAMRANVPPGWQWSPSRKGFVSYGRSEIVFICAKPWVRSAAGSREVRVRVFDFVTGCHSMRPIQQQANVFSYSCGGLDSEMATTQELVLTAWSKVESYEMQSDADLIRDRIASGLANDRVLAALFLIQTGDSDSADRVFRSAFKRGEANGSDVIPNADDPLG